MMIDDDDDGVFIVHRKGPVPEMESDVKSRHQIMMADYDH